MAEPLVVLGLKAAALAGWGIYKAWLETREGLDGGGAKPKPKNGGNSPKP